MKLKDGLVWIDESLDVESTMRLHRLKVCYGFDPDNTKGGGVTIVYGKTSENKNAKMVEISVAYCAPGDAFCKKTGLALAVDRWLNGNTIFVPVRTHGQNWTVPVNLVRMFWDFPQYSLL